MWELYLLWPFWHTQPWLISWWHRLDSTALSTYRVMVIGYQCLVGRNDMKWKNYFQWILRRHKESEKELFVCGTLIELEEAILSTYTASESPPHKTKRHMYNSIFRISKGKVKVNWYQAGVVWKRRIAHYEIQVSTMVFNCIQYKSGFF